jgi:hypothetical protein
VFQSVQVRDVRVVEGGEDLCFALEAGVAVRSGSSAKSSGSIFNATSRPSFSSVARHTSPIPPAPSCAVIR